MTIGPHLSVSCHIALLFCSLSAWIFSYMSPPRFVIPACYARYPTKVEKEREREMSRIANNIRVVSCPLWFFHTILQLKHNNSTEVINVHGELKVIKIEEISNNLYLNLRCYYENMTFIFLIYLLGHITTVDTDKSDLSEARSILVIRLYMGHPASGGYKYRGPVLQVGGWVWG